MMKRMTLCILCLFIINAPFGCKKMDDLVKGINVENLMKEFSDSWKKEDWKRMYGHVHPQSIAEFRKNQTEEQKKKSDEEFFIELCAEKKLKDPSFALKEFSIVKLPIVRKGNQEVKVEAIINGRQKTIPIKLDGMAFKVDLYNIK